MRTRERLIEIIDTLGDSVGSAALLTISMAADRLSGNWSIDELLQLSLQRVIDRHQSPHIRELAAEALHYLREDANATR